MDTIPSVVMNATQQLGWQIVGPPRPHPEGIVYLCRDAAGLTEPYTAAAILTQLAHLHAYAVADLPTDFPAYVTLSTFQPSNQPTFQPTEATP